MTFWSVLSVILLVIVGLVGLSRLLRRVTVFEYQHGLRFDRGKLTEVLMPGSYWIVSPITSIQLLDARPKFTTIPGQELLSSDGVGLKVSVLLETRVTDPRKATLAAASYEASLYAKTQVALRAAVGEKPMDEVLKARDDLSTRLQAEVEPVATQLGLELLSISIKDIMFPGSLKDAFSQTARAKQEAQATLERARGETAALRKLANAARMFENNPNLFQLRLLQAASDASKIVLQVSPPETNQAGGSSEAAT